jgi:RNA polymerase sigma factor (sigma-70 family)
MNPKALKVQNVAKQYFEDRNEKNFNELYKVCLPIVKAASNNILRNSALVEEIAQTVFIKIHSNLNYKFVDDKSFLSYIYTLSQNFAKISYNKSSKSKVIAISKLNIFDDIEDSNDLLDIINKDKDENIVDIECCELLHNSSDKQYNRVLNIVENLDEEKLIFFKDAIFSQNDYTQIKEKYNLNTEGAVKTRVHRIRDKIRSAYKEELISSDFEDGNHNVKGNIRLYHNNGELKFEFTLNSNSKIHGVVKKFDEDGCIVSSMTYNNGVLDGRNITYFNNGEIKISGSYKNGLRHGIFKTYGFDDNSNHILLETIDYYEGTKGYYEIFDENGLVEQSGIFS